MEGVAQVYGQTDFVASALGEFGQLANNNMHSLHADYFEDARYVLSAVVYGEPTADLEGGRTIFLDADGDGGIGLERRPVETGEGAAAAATAGLVPTSGLLVSPIVMARPFALPFTASVQFY